jgi:hypothetical protein
LTDEKLKSKTAHDRPLLEISPVMIAAGAEAVLEVVGGADLGGSFSAPDLAERVYRAMARASQQARREPPK